MLSVEHNGVVFLDLILSVGEVSKKNIINVYTISCIKFLILSELLGPLMNRVSLGSSSIFAFLASCIFLPFIVFGGRFMLRFSSI